MPSQQKLSQMSVLYQPALFKYTESQVVLTQSALSSRRRPGCGFPLVFIGPSLSLSLLSTITPLTLSLSFSESGHRKKSTSESETFDNSWFGNTEADADKARSCAKGLAPIYRHSFASPFGISFSVHSSLLLPCLNHRALILKMRAFPVLDFSFFFFSTIGIPPRRSPAISLRLQFLST